MKALLIIKATYKRLNCHEKVLTISENRKCCLMMNNKLISMLNEYFN